MGEQGRPGDLRPQLRHLPRQGRRPRCWWMERSAGNGMLLVQPGHGLMGVTGNLLLAFKRSIN